MEKTTKKQETMSFISMLAEIAYENGLADGLEAGQQIGFVAGVLSLKSALSSGVRHGSSECGKALESLKRIGID